jgi:anti-anti-sigma factor
MASLEQIDLEDLVIVRLKGSLTTDGIAQVNQQFEALTVRPGVRAVVDLTHVEMVTTPAISMFIAATASSRQTGGRIVFTESPPPVREVLQRLRLDTILTTVNGLAEAIRTVRGEPD